MKTWQKYEDEIAQIAFGLDGGDLDLYDDLFSTMCISLWQAPEEQTKSWYLQKAKNAALNFLDWWEKKDNKGRLRETPFSSYQTSQQAHFNNLAYGLYEEED